MIEHYLDRLARTINENWDNPALTDFYLTEDGTAQDTTCGNRYTYGEMYLEMLRLGELFATLGLQKGDHIAICGANSAHWAIAYLAIAAYQDVAVTILHGQSTEEIAHQIDFSDAKALFTDADLWEELQSQSLPQIEHVIDLENWQVLRGKEIPIINHKFEIINQDCRFSHGGPDDLAMICFTSGSTGNPKGVMSSIKGVSTSIEWAAALYPSKENKHTLSLFPFAHFLAFGTLLGSLITGCNVFVMKSVVTPQSYIAAVLITRPYILPIVPQFAQLLLLDKYQHLCDTVKDFLDYCVVAGAGISNDIINNLIKKNLPITTGFGLTEAPIVSSISPRYYKIGSVGKVQKQLDSRIAANGEIVLRGDIIMLGYYKDPEATAAKIDSDGWLHTGDKGHLDEDGYLYVEGRMEQDMIVLPNGENIHPEDIERKINTLPEVSESIVLARDGKLVAIVVAYPQPLPIRRGDDLRRTILRAVNPQLPLFSQLYDVEITDVPLQRTEKQTIKRYLYR